jgi:S-formylglutathione hydrolase FrmB
LGCGASDFFLDTNRAFVQQLSSRNLPYEYHETAGGHTWEYWDDAVRPLLQAVDHALNSGGAVSKIGRAKKKLH